MISLIQLERQKPLILIKIEALIGGRLKENHHKMQAIEKDYASYKTGYQGEVNLDYYFSLMDQDKYDFFNGLRLFNGQSYFQIDTLITTREYILLIEIKKLSGTIVYDKKTNQFTRNETAITNPFSQVRLQKIQFIDWLQSHNFPPTPVDFLISMANNSTKFECPSGYPDQFWKLCYGHDLIEKVQIYNKSYKIEHFSTRNLKRLKKLLLKEHTPYDVDILKKYGIPKEDITTGVLCPRCIDKAMSYSHGLWTCSHCEYQSKNDHIKALQDYFLLFGPTITNKQFRDFMQIESRHVATRLLAAMKLPFTGNKSGRIYYSPDSKPVVTQSKPAISTQKPSTDSIAFTSQ
jgi:hypothetical protein